MKKLVNLAVLSLVAMTMSACSDENDQKVGDAGKTIDKVAGRTASKVMTDSAEVAKNYRVSSATGAKPDPAADEQALMSIVPEAARASRGPHAGGAAHDRLKPEQWLQVALQHLARGREAEAKATLGRAIGRFPQDYRLRGVRASLHLRKKNYAMALADLETAIKAKPDDPLLLINRAQAYRGFRRNKEAMKDLDRAIELAPDLLGARFNRGALYFEQGRFVRAREDFEHCVATDPHAAAPRFNLAMTLDAMGQRDKAVGELRRFLKINKHGGWRSIATKQLERWGQKIPDDKKGQAGGRVEKPSATADSREKGPGKDSAAASVMQGASSGEVGEVKTQ